MTAYSTSPAASPRRSGLHAQAGVARTLVVDDDEAVSRTITAILRRAGYMVETATSGAVALELLHAMPFDVMLCDVRMPVLSGLELLREALAIDEHLAVIMLSGALDAATATTALRAGALNYVTKPFDLDELLTAVTEALRTRQMRVERHRVERMVREEVALRTAELEREQQALRAITVSVAESLINAMEAKDVYLRGHSHRVAAFAAAIAEELELAADTVEAIRLAGRLHDVGKIGIRESILNKPGRLTPEEYDHVKQHVRLGMEILTPLAHLGPVLTYVHHHHEHWDGKGYPQGLSGGAISLGGRILTAADAFDALTSARAYREPLSREEALAILAEQNGTLLDPDVLDALRHMLVRRKSLVFIDVESARPRLGS